MSAARCRCAGIRVRAQPTQSAAAGGLAASKSSLVSFASNSSNDAASSSCTYAARRRILKARLILCASGDNSDAKIEPPDVESLAKLARIRVTEEEVC